MASPSFQFNSSGPGRHFATTRWSLILAAQRQDVADARRALAELCEIYWYPLYAYVRRQGWDRASAEDLTQEFFARLLRRRDWEGVSPDRGRFRAYLLAAMKHFLANEWDKARAEKRGGGKRLLSLDFESAESRYQAQPADHRTPDLLFERAWALTLLGRVQTRLREEFAGAGKLGQFERLEGYLTGESGQRRYAEAARDLGMSEAAVKVSVHRLRRRFRELLRGEIAQTVAGAEEIDSEIQRLFEALQR